MARRPAKSKAKAGSRAQDAGGSGGRRPRARNGRSAGGKQQEKSVANDVFSDEEDEAGEARREANMDVDGVYEYEAPEHFDHDSEIDEDEAFDSQDERDFGGFFDGRGGKKQAAKEQDDDDEDEEDAAGGDLLSDMLGTAPASRLSTANDEDDEDALAPSDDEADEPQRLANLQSLVDGLVPAAAKAKPLTDIDTTVLRGSSGAALTGVGGSGELTLGSLLGTAAGADDETTSSLNRVKKQVRDIETDGSAALQVALAPVQEERAARKTAYVEKAKDMDLFQPVVRRNRQKETLDLRQQGPRMDTLTSAALTSKFSAQTDMEKSVAALLVAGDLSDRQVAKDEQDELERKHVSKEEVAQRQKELAKLRSLMFYEEQKQKRVKKIKSKLYHKIRNAQDKKAADKHRKQLRELDPELAQRLDEELAEKRAEERLTLKHTNTSKWVKHQLKRGVLADNETRGAIAEQLRRGEELRRKMNTVDSDDDMGDDDDDEDDDGDEGDAVSRLQKRLEKQANALVTEIDEDTANAGKVKGLHGMKFMQRAVQKQREKARSEAEKLLREIRGDGDDLLSDGDNYVNSDDEQAQVEKSKKRKSKKKAVVVTAEDTEAVAKALANGALQTGSVSMDTGLSARASGAIAVDLGESSKTTSVQLVTTVSASTTLEVGAKDKKKASEASKSVEKTDTEATNDAAEEEGGENPWLASAAPKSKKRNSKKAKAALAKQQQSGADVASAIDSLAKSVEQDVTAKTADKSASKKRKLDQSATAENSSEAGEAPSTDAIPLSEGTKKKNKAKKQKNGKTASSGNDKSGLEAQEALVRRAFAFADEDEDEIAQEKDQLASSDAQAKKGAEIARLVGMSGWGSWAGDGVQVSFRQKRREEQAKKLAADTKQQALASRKDAKMDRVLINEKKDKRATKFTVQDVPYPFTSREEYEMAMRNPLGSDWNTPAATNKLTAPKIMKRAGTIINPLVLTKEDKKQAKKELAKQRKAKF